MAGKFCAPFVKWSMTAKSCSLGGRLSVCARSPECCVHPFVVSAAKHHCTINRQCLTVRLAAAAQCTCSMPDVRTSESQIRLHQKTGAATRLVVLPINSSTSVLTRPARDSTSPGSTIPLTGRTTARASKMTMTCHVVTSPGISHVGWRVSCTRWCPRCSRVLVSKEATSHQCAVKAIRQSKAMHRCVLHLY